MTFASYLLSLRGSLSLAVTLALAGCGGDGGGPASSVPDAAPVAAIDAAVPEVDASRALDDDAGSLSRDAALDAASVDARVAYVAPTVSYPTAAPTGPFLLSQLGLYLDMQTKAFAPDLIAYQPTYTLWSDGADKDRHLRLPAGSTIDDSDPDHWQFPVGTVLFKEFALAGKKLETRVVARIGTGARDYFFGAFVWRDDESDAELAWDGQNNVRGSEHDVPTVKQCGTCHNGEPGRVLGVSAVQTVAAVTPFLQTPLATPYHVPGNAVEATALGYLHANCGHCHNPNGSARPDTDLNLRLAVAQQTVTDTNIYTSAVGKQLQSFMGGDLTLRITAGDPSQSGLYYRMSQRGPLSQMPPLATELADATGLAAVAAFISSLSPPPR